MPWIERVQVEEGFLDGLDLSLAPGLNVVIGARGTGKTSLIELIRFALGAPAFTDQAGQASEQQVRGVLGRGRVRLTVRMNDGAVIPVRREIGAAPDPGPVRATVLAQNEIEAVGASETGRLHLIDRFWDASALTSDIIGLRSRLAATARQVQNATVELTNLRDQVSDVSALEQQLAELKEQQQHVLKQTSATDEQRQRLDELQADLRQTSLRTRLIGQSEAHVTSLYSEVFRLTADSSDMPTWPADAGADPTGEAQLAYTKALSGIESVAGELDRARALLRVAQQKEIANQSDIEEETRELRQILGSLDAEAANLASRMSELNEQLGSRRATAQLADERAQQLEKLVSQRDAIFAELDGRRDDRFSQRSQVAETLNHALGSSIRIVATRSGSTEDYEDAIVAGLRGSGIHRTIAPAIAAAISPLELAKAAEGGDTEFVAKVTGLASSRVSSALNQLRATIPTIISTAIDDSVELFLLDGTSFKASGDLSIGQRCTTVLPVLLQRRGDILVIDQPEDHLDNAFVTSTLVETLRSRHPDDQIILASHNANIPVLGEADLVVHLASDGSRGYVACAGGLDKSTTVTAITNVMEGGAQAFRRRAEFYGKFNDVP